MKDKIHVSERAKVEWNVKYSTFLSLKKLPLFDMAIFALLSTYKIQYTDKLEYCNRIMYYLHHKMKHSIGLLRLAP